MAGTILITGGNSSLGIPAVQHLLSQYPEYTALVTVRSSADSDANTRELRAVISQHTNANTSIRQLDLSSDSDVQGFANAVAREISEGKLPPISGIVCNAFHYSVLCTSLSLDEPLVEGS